MGHDSTTYPTHPLHGTPGTAEVEEKPGVEEAHKTHTVMRGEEDYGSAKDGMGVVAKCTQP